MLKRKIPLEIEELLNRLESYGYFSYIVGQGVADFILEKEPKTWRVATSALFQEITQIFPQTFFTAAKENYITVVIWQRPIELISLKTLEEHFSRSSFSLESLAYDWKKAEIIDPFHAQDDLAQRLIRALMPTEKLFRSRPLEMLRAVRLGAQYQFTLPKDLIEKINTYHLLLEQAPLDKVRDELALILLTSKPSSYLKILSQASIFKLLLPEIEKAFYYNLPDKLNLAEHLFLTVDYLPQNLELRLAGLFHDLGKADLKPVYTKGEAIFPGHEDISAQKGKKILNRLNLFTKVVGHNVNHHKIISLIRNHMFSYNPNTTTDKGMERLVARVGIENIKDLLALRKANILAGSQTKQSKMDFYQSLEKHLKKVLRNL